MTRGQWAKGLLGLVVVPIAVLFAVIVRQLSDEPWALGTTIVVAVSLALAAWAALFAYTASAGARTAAVRRRFPGAVVVNSTGMTVTVNPLVAIGGPRVPYNMRLTLVFDARGVRLFTGGDWNRPDVEVPWQRVGGITQGTAVEDYRSSREAVLVLVQTEAGVVVVPFACVTELGRAADEFWVRDRIREIEAIRPASPASG